MWGSWGWCGLVELDEPDDVETTVTPEDGDEELEEPVDEPASATRPETSRFALGVPRPVTRS